MPNPVPGRSYNLSLFETDPIFRARYRGGSIGSRAVEPHPFVPEPVPLDPLLIVDRLTPSRAELFLGDEYPLGDVVSGMADQTELSLALQATLFHRML